MKKSMSIVELAQEVQRQQEAKKDFTAPTTALKANNDGKVELDGIGNFELTRNANTQIAQRLNIPQKYFDRMKEDAPDLWATNVNHWFKNAPESRMVRTLDGKIRAFLSDKYRILDNVDLLENLMPTLMERDDLIIESSHVDENKIYLKAFFKSLEKEVGKDAKVGDLIRAGLMISNSEVGGGSLMVAPMTYRLWCTNGAISDMARRKYHVEARKKSDNDRIQNLLTDETKIAKDKAFWMETRDLVKGCMTMDFLNEEVAKYSDATTQKILAPVIEVVNNATKHFNLNESQNQSVLNHLIKDGDLSKYGLFNAVTRTAQDQESYEDATNLELIGSKVINLNKTEWSRMAETV